MAPESSKNHPHRYPHLAAVRAGPDRRPATPRPRQARYHRGL